MQMFSCFFWYETSQREQTVELNIRGRFTGGGWGALKLLKHGFESTTKERENHGGRELGILFVIKRFIYVVFVHVLPSGYPNANEGDPDGWAAPSLVCILSTDNNLHFFLALCVSLDYETLALIRLRFGSTSDCQACEEVDTYENIMDNYCRADFVARTKLRRVRRNKVSGKKSKMLKMSSEMREEWRRNQRPNLIMELGDDCCTDHFNTVALSRTAAGGSNGGDRFLVMGVQRNGQLVPTLILPWTKRSKAIRGAVKAFKQFNCSDPKAVFASETASSVIQGNGKYKERISIYVGLLIDWRSTDRQRRGKQMREKTSTTTTTTSTPTTASTTRKGRGQHGGGQRSRSRADNQHQGQSVRHQHQLQ
ncbi:hypothetical protein OUZ56_007717 [Daphnia magna]|uniref:NTR domain-containing protein n=1 Tax=Daphnia magna TaxID=35525 RepID=A0ABR0AB03_9CRUS|nr:hypothetical protein OUZ56_007717 [Daphnia magna]